MGRFRLALYLARKEARISQATVARAAGINRKTYMRIERGESEPTWGQALAIAELLRRDPIELFGDHDVHQMHTVNTQRGEQSATLEQEGGVA